MDTNLYLLARLAGLTAFGLMFVQLVTGPLGGIIRRWVGVRWQLRLHIWSGLVAFALAWLHPALLVGALGWQTVLTLGGYAIFGKVSLLLLTVGVAAGLARTVPWLVRQWRWVHRLNYLVFVLIYLHSWNLGSDVRSFPIVLFFWLAPVVWVGAVVYQLRQAWSALRQSLNPDRDMV